jgi:hypothetical protein
MDTQIGWGKTQPEEQIKCMDGVGSRGDVRSCEIWLHFRMSVQVFIGKESKR